MLWTLLACGAPEPVTSGPGEGGTTVTPDPREEAPDDPVEWSSEDLPTSLDLGLPVDTSVPEPELPESLEPYITRTAVALPEANFPAVQSYCTFEHCSINPRTYHQTLDDGRLVMGWTSNAWRGYVSLVEDGAIPENWTWDGWMVRGLTADDEGFTVMLLEDPTGSPKMWLTRMSWEGEELWSKDMNLTANVPKLYLDSAGWIGDTRLATNGDTYAAYFPVQNPDGHHGDQYTLYSADGELQDGGWNWGCSHSLAALVEAHPSDGSFLPICVSDTYPSYGVIAQASRSIYEAGSAENGLTSASLGQLAPTDDGWLLAFNAMERPCCEAHGIALVELDHDGDPVSDIVWITDTAGQDERDPVLARVGQDRYLLGWRNTATDQFPLLVVDKAGNVLVEEDDVLDAGIFWGRRDDSFKVAPDGSVTWISGVTSHATMYAFRFALE